MKKEIEDMTNEELQELLDEVKDLRKELKTKSPSGHSFNRIWTKSFPTFEI